MDAKQPQPDHSGLQAIETNDAPEVVQSTSLRGPLERRSSMHSPEAFTPYGQNRKQPQGYFHETETPQPGQDVRAYYAPPPGYEGNEKHAAEPEQPRERRIWGMKRNVFFIVLAIVILVVIAAVVGGVCGGILGVINTKSSSSNSSPTSTGSGSSGSNSSLPLSPPINAANNSGFALMVPASSSDSLPALFSYYQRTDGALIELSYNSTNMQIVSNDTVVAGSSAASGSPLAVTSWVSNSHTTRQLFYIDGNGNVMTTNTTGSNPWSVPYNVLTGDSADPDTIALTVCSGTAAQNTGLDGIRVYYGSGSCPGTTSSECIREVGMDFFESSQPVWHMWGIFPGSDVKSGVSCTLSNNVNHLYFRNTSTSTPVLQQWQWSYVDQYVNHNAAWRPIAQGSSNMTAGSDIAASSDGTTDSIFYQSTDEHLERALYYGSNISNTVELGTAAQGTKLTAAYANSSAMVIYQMSSNGSVYYDMVTRGGQEAGAKMIA
ncbi:hypothetical protein BAUCODRAFT_147252 [Baudoinia panamericana UAMH 10762]|uniref:Fucose-specific lectin n=1 Tax=Baudoinia panamericana (strain UAMH 10762) TaxID=717646 RepID=M2LRL0_BAUPA|nr:uncharacterized protein BAUCODRAFT_147252 [Baudoinia panamericana UAMH 10762]EMC97087.1 hypothetical protein BAUCODRAFT_147252 [Baudoinia panamericana UAMH 10762]